MTIDFPLHYIDKPDELEKLKAHLETLDEFALDLEADVNLHRYGRKLCLAQIWDGNDCWLVDLRVLDISCLKSIMEDQAKLKIMYAASFDVSLLADVIGFELQGLFDIQICTSILGNGKRSLKYFIKETFDIDLEKDMQTSDWYKRPLTQDQLIYAAYDVRYLLEAKEIMLAQLETDDLLENAYDAFHKVESSRFHEVKDPYLRVRNSAKLTPYEKIRLKEFYDLREKIAEKWDLPTYKILRSHQLLKLCLNPPLSKVDLDNMEVFNEKLSEYKDDFLSASLRAEELILIENSKMKDEIIEFRHLLHKHPELAGKENSSEKRIFRFIRNFSPTKIYRNLGRNSSIYSFNSGNEGPVVFFRVNIDAENGIDKAEHDWVSRTKKIVHHNGNDGHVAILLTLAASLFEQKLKKGKVALLFQASSQNGKGAIKVIKDKRFGELSPDFIFSFQNLPGYKKECIVLSDSAFSPAVSNLIINIAEIKECIHEEEYKDNLSDVCLKICSLLKEADHKSYIKHIQFGKPNLVIHPVKAEIRVELIQNSDENLRQLQEDIREKIENLCLENRLYVNVQQIWTLPASKSHPEAVDLIKKSLYDHEFVTEPENVIDYDDMGCYYANAKIAQFGIGTGEDSIPLKRCNYDFPDDMIEPSVNILLKIISEMDMI